MNIKDIVEIINSIQIATNNNSDFLKLRSFANAMLSHQYYSITDDELHKGMDYIKTVIKNTIKVNGSSIEQQRIDETNTESLCKEFENMLLSYKHKYEKQNNHVI